MGDGAENRVREGKYGRRGYETGHTRRDTLRHAYIQMHIE